MTTIPFNRPDITEQEAQAVQSVLMSGMLASGQTVEKFEHAFAQHVGAKHAVAVGSCTQGYQLLFNCLRENREVWTTVNTFTGPAMMARKDRQFVRLIDVTPGEFTTGIDVLMRAPKGSVVMPVHFAGKPLDIPRLKAERPDLIVYDDAAHALGGELDGKRVGGQGADATVFSFYPGKPITTGHGGMITTNDGELATRLRRDRLHGFSKDLKGRYETPGANWHYDVVSEGLKVNMNDMAAALGIEQLKREPQMHVRRMSIASIYHSYFDESRHLRTMDDKTGLSAHHLFPIRVLDGRRDMLADKLAVRGIGTSVHFIPLHRHKVWSSSSRDGAFPVADRLYFETLSLPIYSKMEIEDAHHVAESVMEIMRGGAA